MKIPGPAALRVWMKAHKSAGTVLNLQCSFVHSEGP